MRFTFVILLFCCLGADAQMIIKAHANYRPLAQPVVNLLLDDYPNAAAAYSLRKLDKDYTGSAIRVRRSNDNTEQDIGFTSSGDLDTASLKTFVGANSGFVTTWYDQSGNARNATQTTAANQLTIITSGTVLRRGSRPTLRLVDNSDFFTHTKAPSLSNDVYYVTHTTDNTYIIQMATASDFGYVAQSGSGSTSIYQTYGTPTLFINNNQFTGTTRNNVHSAYNNIFALSAIINCNTFSWLSVRIGSYPGGGGFEWNGDMSEYIFYTTTGSNRTGIQNNINTYYSIY
jgi:hypothetical protein